MPICAKRKVCLRKGGCARAATRAGRACWRRSFMASQQEEEDLAFSAAYEDDTPTPPGWKRKLVPRIGKGMVPVRTDVIFITPSGEEFKSRAQLQRYLKANKGSPSLSEFIWIVDGLPQRSTRSKSTPMVKLLEIPSRAASKRKPGTEINEVGIGKRRHTGKTQKSDEEPKVIKGKHIKKANLVTPSEGKDEGKELSGSSPASTKKKRSVKVTRRINRGSTPTLTTSANTNGIADIGSKDENTDEAAKKFSANKASKGKRSKGRPGGKKGVLQHLPVDDLGQEADVTDKLNFSADATNAESDAKISGEGNHHEDKADMEFNNETMAVVDQESPTL